MKHSNPYALVTGASSGIGREIALRLAGQKHNLVLVARSAEPLEALAREIRHEHGTEALVLVADLGLEKGADEVFAQVERLGLELTVLVNNAGFGLFGKHTQTRLEDEQQMIAVNITALTRLTKLVLPGMVRRKCGYVMNIASTAAFQPGPYMAVYYATKAYVLSYSEAVNEELRGTNVSVTAVCPGPTRSGFQDRAVMQDSALVKGKRLPGAEEVAAFAVDAMLRRRAVAIPGLMNWLMSQSVRLTPRSLVTRLVALMSKPVPAA